MAQPASQYLCIKTSNPVLQLVAQCLINTLLNLSSAALQLFKQFLEAELTFIDVAVYGLIVQLEAADILAQEVQAAKDFAEAELQQLEQLLNGLPLGLLDTSCTDWAGLNGGINGFLQNEIVPPVEQILFELNRVLSLQTELGLLKAEYEALKQFLLNVIDVLDLLILEKKCREAAGV
jgi:hypothetical protein